MSVGGIEFAGFFNDVIWIEDASHEGIGITDREIINAIGKVLMKLGSVWEFDCNGNWSESVIGEDDLNYYKMCLGYSKRNRSSVQGLRENINEKK